MSVEREVTVRSRAGLHSRPAARVVKLAGEFQSDIQLVSGQRTVSARSLIGIMSLGISQGEKVVVRVSGPDEAEAMAALEALLESDPDEAAPADGGAR